MNVKVKQFLFVYGKAQTTDFMKCRGLKVPFDSKSARLSGGTVRGQEAEHAVQMNETYTYVLTLLTCFGWVAKHLSK